MQCAPFEIYMKIHKPKASTTQQPVFKFSANANSQLYCFQYQLTDAHIDIIPFFGNYEQFMKQLYDNHGHNTYGTRIRFQA